MAAAARKYAGLPDLDDAPDIFETPELTEDNTTTAASATFPASSSRASSPSDTSRDGINRSRLDQDSARARFLGSRVDARTADFSDRLSGGNSKEPRSYVVRTSKRSRQRRRQQQRARRDAAETSTEREGKGAGDEDDDEDDDDESTDGEDDGTPEGLRRKLARLNREAAELRAEMEKLHSEQGEEGGTDEEGVDALDRQLVSLNKTILHGQAASGAAGRLASKLGTKLAPSGEQDQAGSEEIGDSTTPAYTITYAPSYDSSHALARAAAFDGRLALLEAALGLERIPLPTQEDTPSVGTGAGPAYPKPVLPTLDILDKQLAALAATTATGGAALDTVSRRVSQLIRDAEKLADARKAAKNAHEDLTDVWARNGRTGGAAGAGNNGLGRGVRRSSEDDDDDNNLGRSRGLGGGGGNNGGSGDVGGLGLDDPELVAKVNALHGALPTIEALAPVLPGLLDRLRSLRLVHADASMASASLAQLEKRQAEVDAEIKEWAESVEKVEAMLKGNEQHVGGNMQVVEKWVKELEARVKAL